MKINVPLPFDREADPSAFFTLEGVAKVGAAIERAGFEAACVTDHPCPTGRWIDSGGHYAQDPFVMLALVASVTKTIRLQTGILVLPYRNPFIVARAVATLDVYSQGRVSLGFGAGYLKGEYRALGVDFDARNDLMDEYLRALKLALSGEEFAFEGTGYQAFGNRILPGPLQKPHPPFLVGGNAPRAIRRAVELGDAWYPFFTAGLSTATTRTADFNGIDDLKRGMEYMHAHCEKVGRTTPPEVRIGSIRPDGEPWSNQRFVDELGKYAEIGVVSGMMTVHGESVEEWCDEAERIGEEVIRKLDALEPASA
jgi:probable F420-dependent oxidoreductase